MQSLAVEVEARIGLSGEHVRMAAICRQARVDVRSPRPTIHDGVQAFLAAPGALSFWSPRSQGLYVRTVFLCGGRLRP